MFAFGVVIVVLGVFAAAMGIFQYLYYKESGWERTTAQIVGEFSYTQRTMPRPWEFMSKSNPVTHTQARILYNVNGKVYEKTVFTDETGKVEIYYRQKKPDYFHSADEFKKRTGVSHLIAGIVFGILLFALGIALIVSG